MNDIVIGGLYRRRNSSARNIATIGYNGGDNYYLIWLSMQSRKVVKRYDNTIYFHNEESIRRWIKGADYLGNLSEMIINVVSKMEEEE